MSKVLLRCKMKGHFKGLKLRARSIKNLTNYSHLLSWQWNPRKQSKVSPLGAGNKRNIDGVPNSWASISEEVGETLFQAEAGLPLKARTCERPPATPAGVRRERPPQPCLPRAGKAASRLTRGCLRRRRVNGVRSLPGLGGTWTGHLVRPFPGKGTWARLSHPAMAPSDF